VEALTESVEIEVDAYVIEGVSFERAYNHSAAVRLTLADEVLTRTELLPVGTYVVRTGQMRGRLAAHMLEAETNDNVVYWNTMDAWLPIQEVLDGDGEDPPLLPIYKLMEPRGLPLRLVN
jgi:hypothetical protein